MMSYHKAPGGEGGGGTYVITPKSRRENLDDHSEALERELTRSLQSAGEGTCVITPKRYYDSHSNVSALKRPKRI